MPTTHHSLGYIIFLADDSDRANLIHYASYRRVVSSVLGAEIYSFADAFDKAFSIKHELESLVQRAVPLEMFTDSKSLLDVITKCSSTSERRLMIDIQIVRDAYSREEISDVGFIRSDQNPADALTKLSPCRALEDYLTTGRLHIIVDQWIIRRRNIHQTGQTTSE